jgi:hypothetical protein
MRLRTDGTVETKSTHSDEAGKRTEKWKPAFVVRGDEVSRDGRVMGNLRETGLFVPTNDELVGFTIENDAIVLSNARLAIDANGGFTGGRVDARPLRAEGVSEPKARRLALLVTAVVLTAPVKLSPAPPPRPRGP